MFGTNNALFDELQRIQREMDAVFGTTPWVNGIRSSAGSFPAVNVGTTVEEIDVYVFAPGVDPSAFEISVQNNVLNVSGKRPVIREDGASYYRKERFDGEFRRTFTLPEDADPERVDASYADGILHIKIQRRESSKPRQIKVS
jgi:HSP20 family protein